jgi:NAD(P)-dependent dehydrogenase (short-subunit alcohol dehydrogenase family)
MKPPQPRSERGTVIGNKSRRLEGRVCVVAGALGTIGEAVAQRFIDEGGIVVGIDRDPHSIGTWCLQADLSKEDIVHEQFARVMAEFGRLDVLYNNIGPIDREDRSALDTSLETWNRVLASILTTTWLCCRHAVPHMLKGSPPNGSVINTGSFLAGMGAASAQMAFNAAKAGVEQLTRDLGVHLARSGIRVNALALGPVETPEIRATFDRLGPHQVARRFTHMPMGRFCTPDELAATAAYLASDDSGFVTASTFPIDGGIRGAFTVPEQVIG